MKNLFAIIMLIALPLTICACGAPPAETPVYAAAQETAAVPVSTPGAIRETVLTEDETTENDETAEETGSCADTVPNLSGDGTYRKYYTISFDDGITQDLQIIEIFKKYDFTSCTFFINTGLCGANWKQVGRMYDRPDVTHIRFTKKELESGIYDRFDVAVHTLTHQPLKKYDKKPDSIRREVERDAENIYRMTGVYPVGMAWPGGENDVTETTKKIVYEKTSIRFARGAEATHSFELPEEFLMWQPTCSIIDDDVLEKARLFVEAECTEDMLFFVWGHGYELDIYDAYEELEELIIMMTEADDIICVTTTEFYQLFKEKIPSLK